MQGCGSDVVLSVEGLVMSERRRVNFKEVDVQRMSLTVRVCLVLLDCLVRWLHRRGYEVFDPRSGDDIKSLDVGRGWV